MMRKILTLVILSMLVSCGTSYSTRKSHGSTARNTSRKSRTPKKETRVATTRTPRSNSSSKGSTRSTETLEATSKTTVYADVVKQYILDFKGIAQDNMRNHGIPASITLAQGILESGAGRGTLCVNANNHFGIKCHTGWEGESVFHDDDAKGECFRKYKDPAESYNDHSLFLTTRNRYAALFRLDKNDYEGWAHGLKSAGYATDPKYPDKLIGLIEKYDLAQYDAEVLGGRYTPKPKVVPAPVPVPVAESIAQEQVIAMNMHKVQQGDTLYSISKKYNITVDELRNLNGLSGNAISIGQVLKVK